MKYVWELCLVTLLVIVVMVFIIAYWQPGVADDIHSHVHVPVFNRGDCFDRNGAKESWEASPDGIIERVGKDNYLVLFRAEAEKRSLKKYASTLSIPTFDLSHHKVACPLEWIKHTRKDY